MVQVQFCSLLVLCNTFPSSFCFLLVLLLVPGLPDGPPELWSWTLQHVISCLRVCRHSSLACLGSAGTNTPCWPYLLTELDLFPRISLYTSVLWSQLRCPEGLNQLLAVTICLCTMVPANLMASKWGPHGTILVFRSLPDLKNNGSRGPWAMLC